MGIYYGIFGVLVFFSLIELFGLKNKQRNIMFIIFSLFMFCLSFLRWETGTDWQTYYDFFNSSINWFDDNEFEWGFARLNEISKILFDNYSVLLFLLGAILFLFQTIGIYKLSPYPITSLLFLWSVSFGNAMFVRQTVAVAIVLFSVTYIIKRQFWGFIICILFAMLFHRSSFIFIPAWWLYRMNIPNVWLWVGIFISIGLTSIIKYLFESMSGVMGPVVQQKIDLYLGDGDQSFGTSSSIVQIIIRGFANKVILFIWLMFICKRAVAKYGQPYKGLLNIYWAGILLYFSTIGISVAMVRFSFSYDILQIILCAMSLGVIEEKRLRLLSVGIFFIYLSLRLYMALTGSYYDLFVPIKTILD